MPLHYDRSCRSLTRGTDGYSLLEVMVVLTLVSIALITSVGLGRISNSNHAIDLVSRTITSELLWVRAKAITQKRIFSLQLVTTHKNTYISMAEKRINLPSEMSIRFVGVPFADRVAEAAKVAFFPDGSSSGGSLVLSQGAKSREIKIDWLTGSISNERFNPLTR